MDLIKLIEKENLMDHCPHHYDDNGDSYDVVEFQSEVKEDGEWTLYDVGYTVAASIKLGSTGDGWITPTTPTFDNEDVNVTLTHIYRNGSTIELDEELKEEIENTIKEGIEINI